MSDVPVPVEPPKSLWQRIPIRLDAIVIVVVIVTAMLGFWDTSQSGLLVEGTAAPPFELVMHQGGKVKLSDYAGKVVVLDFWATWCPPCIEEMPWLTRYGSTYKGGGVVFLAVSQDDPETRRDAVNTFVMRNVPELGEFVAYGDPLTARTYGVVALPTLYVIGRDGKIVGAARGSVSERKVRSWIADASERK